MMRIIWQTVRRITNEILGVKGLKLLFSMTQNIIMKIIYVICGLRNE